MSARKEYPRVESAAPLDGKRLLVTFVGGVTKVYDCTPLLACGPFEPLADEAVFQCARADAHGYGVIWNDDIDLAESELWENGTQVEQAHATDEAVPRR
ncbi:MAG: DUF2442 domain-containing protein [Planctomycetota bacterium]|jgi:hypothetical protein